ncbi:MAG TPA: farnesyl diphosphate synthase [Halanaerobiales bacterium]|nr:farnesyl diphosphate synthase [Halanaerobiales bacterium]
MKKINEIIKTEKAKIDKKIAAKIDNYRAKSNSSLKNIIDSLEYSLKAGGKRIRPILTVKVAEMLKGDLETAYDLGIALEFIHTYSLIHDDLPAMDDDDYRRGQLSNHKVFGEGMAILAGDALLTLAFEVLSDLNLPAEDKVKIINLTAQMAGFRGMVGGQSLDLEFEDIRVDFDNLNNIHLLKTGALFKAAILGGAYCAQTTEKEMDALESYATKLGLLFQITDDILDKTGDSEVLGKEVGSDEKSNKSTYVSLLGLKEAKSKAKETAESAKKELEPFENSQFLIKLIDFILYRES